MRRKTDFIKFSAITTVHCGQVYLEITKGFYFIWNYASALWRTQGNILPENVPQLDLLNVHNFIDSIFNLIPLGVVKICLLVC